MDQYGVVNKASAGAGRCGAHRVRTGRHVSLRFIIDYELTKPLQFWGHVRIGPVKCHLIKNSFFSV